MTPPASEDIRHSANLERLVKLEVNVFHLTAAVEKTNKALDENNTKLDELTAALNQAKGAKWVLCGLLTLAGFVGGFASKFIPWVAYLPK